MPGALPQAVTFRAFGAVKQINRRMVEPSRWLPLKGKAKFNARVRYQSAFSGRMTIAQRFIAGKEATGTEVCETDD